MLQINQIYRYQTPPAIKSHCHIRIYCPVPPEGHPDCQIIVLTELKNNPGRTITNSWEWLIPLLCRDFELDRDFSIFIEHYPDSEAEFSKVSIQNGHVCWQHLTKDDLEKLISQPFI